MTLGRFSFTMFGAMAALIAVGTVAIWSAGAARPEAYFHGVWRANLATAALGLALYFALAALDYRRVLDWAAWPAYAVSLALLVAVLVVGREVYGGRRWLWFFQPSEIAKLGVIALLAHVAPRLKGFRGCCAAAALVGAPCALILLEPDLGTTLALAPAALAMLFVAGVWRKGLAVVCAVLFAAGFAVLGAVYEAERPGVTAERREAILKWVPLREHQLKRVCVFLFPERDTARSGYNLHQAKIAIGSGGLTGKGLRKGESSRLRYLPPSVSMNDFIFCVYAEETGYVGSLVLLGLFAALVIPCAWTAAGAADPRGRLLAVGVATLLFAHVYVNVAMSIGLVPITGLPLPFVSSGRTFLLTAMAGLGLVQSVRVRRGEGGKVRG